MPCGMVLVGTTTACFCDSALACSAATMTFELLGNKMTLSTLAASTALSRSSQLGFIVWPPRTTVLTPKLSNTRARPSPEATATVAISEISSTAGAGRDCPSTNS